MVSISDVPRINQLSLEFQNNVRAIDLMAQKSRILSMVVGSDDMDDPQRGGISVSVNTAYMPAPEQMIAQIRVLMQQRQEIIRQELHTLGIDVTTMVAAQAAARAEAEAPTPTRRPRK
jgi:hypothetical protein